MAKPHSKTGRGDDLIRGLDCTPQDQKMRDEVRKTADGIAQFYGFETMRIAPIESTATMMPLLRAGFLDERPPVVCEIKSGESIMLLPSGVLGAVRAYFSHRMQSLPHPLKLVFEADAFSMYTKKEGYLADPYELDEAGAKDGEPGIVPRREWGLVMIGEDGPVAEAEVIQVLWKTCRELGLAHETIELRVNAVGCAHCRPSFRSALSAYFRARAARLCSRSKRDLKRAPVKILSCADERCRGIAASAPQVLDFLCERCKKQLRNLLEFFDEAKIPYFLDPGLFREGAWFGEIVFVILLRPETAEKEKEGGEGTPQGAGMLLAEGGRVSRAAELMSGKTLAAVAGTFFLDAAAGELSRRSEHKPSEGGVFFVQLGELAKRKSFEILEALREGGMDVKESLGRDSIKIQLKIAERIGARVALVLGQKEALDGTIIVREVESGIQETVPQEKLVDFLKKKLKK
ncbi:MAG: hypothetical protein A3J58_03055 [Candidatus Sungbacteria bacterium RIFCSPHIGHO2_02_FULL_52_23]|uniref:Histidyl-tRNA synthetase n=1 Tax=Candidatus Sungbacteria bacterium RIFCSPHIGHO2_02_FULL_52_23 TaxID=1802274 RepID=A0A1G2KXZ4_9BACT|nr:MAG: hypothetical protein A3J58_03055 [Candidatus Sungbacteria bacterium RIFCSPHIGHO2_02_FULL_52_23]